MTVDDSRPLISVVVNTYERVDLLPRALRSVLAQKADGVEVLVADDGSPHDVEDVLEAEFSGVPLRYVRQPNAGLSASRNLGWRHARGTFVLFLDDDDEQLPGALEALSALVAGPDVGIASGAAEIVEAHAEVAVVSPQDLGPSMSRRIGIFLAGSFAMRRDVLEAIGGYDESVFTSHQHELFLRAVPFCVQHGLDIVSTSRPVVRIHRAPPRLRGRNRPERLYASSIRVLEVHGDHLRSAEGWTYANVAVSGAVAAAKMDQLAEARRLLRLAVRTQPRNRHHWARLAAAYVPPLGRAIWR